MKFRLLFVGCAVLFGCPAYAEVVTALGYTYLASPNQTFYRDTGHVPGGHGELTDGNTDTRVWGGAIPPVLSDIAPLVGWEDRHPSIQFDFTPETRIDTVAIWFADSDGSAGVNFPRRVTLSDPGSAFSFTISPANPTGAGTMVRLDLDDIGFVGDQLIVDVTKVGQWVHLSEVQFTTTAVPEPSSVACLAVGAAVSVFARRRKNRRVRSASAFWH